MKKLHRVHLVMVSMIARKLKLNIPVFADVGCVSTARVCQVRGRPENRMYPQVKIENSVTNLPSPEWHDASAVFTLEPVPGDE